MTYRAYTIRLAAMAAAATALLAPYPASAQLGKLKKAATDAARGKAGGSGEASAQNSSSNFAITADRLTAVMAMIEVSMDKAAKDAAAKAVETEYNAERKAYEKCTEAQMQAFAGKTPSMDAIQRSTALTEQTASLGQRMVAAQQANRNREYVALTHTMQVSQLRSMLVMYGVDAKCGAPAYMPAAVVDASAAKLTRTNDSNNEEYDRTVVSPAQRAGMTTQEFGMVRERAALWALQQTNNAPPDNNKYGIFTRDEQAVLEAQRATLQRWAPLFKSSPATWSTWGDLKAW